MGKRPDDSPDVSPVSCLRYVLELFHIDDPLKFLRDENFPFPDFSWYSAKIMEFVGGICLILGLFTKWISPLIVMWGIIYTTAHGNIFEAELFISTDVRHIFL